jgi:hypothetical protein
MDDPEVPRVAYFADLDEDALPLYQKIVKLQKAELAKGNAIDFAAAFAIVRGQGASSASPVGTYEATVHEAPEQARRIVDLATGNPSITRR